MDRRIGIKMCPSIAPCMRVSNAISWQDQHEDILRKWKSRCFVNLWLSVASGYFYSVLHNWLSYPVIVMSAVSSAAIFSYDSHVMKFTLGIVTLMCGILTSIMRQMKPGELYQSHTSFAKRYVNLIRAIDTCLSLTVSMRPSPDTFLERIGNELDILESSQLDPPLLIVKRFEKKYGAVHRVLYGEDIIQLMKIEMQATSLYDQIKKQQNRRLSDVSVLTFDKKKYMVNVASQNRERRLSLESRRTTSSRMPSIDERNEHPFVHIEQTKK
jgi:hypothetical protein